ncbi:MAG: NADH-quinone oxidoreductase subunit NuoK [Dermatophilaceae bacterium]|nr:NADH-quinone oxidoreductase subunit NuoK [Dermatophilaceae bacterium]NUR81458.1 NADH-quinone oxidoreductase subunit NuoK [Dermatophilaceae bacterium]
MHLALPGALVALLAGIGVYGVLARRNAVLVLIGVELILNAANLLLVTAGSRQGAPFSAGAVLTLFVITIAAAEITVALAIILVLFRRAGHIDLTAVPDLTDDPDDPDDPEDPDEPSDVGATPDPARSGEGAP